MNPISFGGAACRPQPAFGMALSRETAQALGKDETRASLAKSITLEETASVAKQSLSALQDDKSQFIILNALLQNLKGNAEQRDSALNGTIVTIEQITKYRNPVDGADFSTLSRAERDILTLNLLVAIEKALNDPAKFSTKRLRDIQSEVESWKYKPPFVLEHILSAAIRSRAGESVSTDLYAKELQSFTEGVVPERSPLMMMSGKNNKEAAAAAFHAATGMVNKDWE